MRATKFNDYLQDREELLFVDRPHIIYVIEAVIVAIVLVCGSFYFANLMPVLLNQTFGSDQGLSGFFGSITFWLSQILFWGSVIFSTFFFIRRACFYLSTYIFLSNRRVFMKTGVLFVDVVHADFDEIRATTIDYGIFGRFMGYAKLSMDARFVKDQKLPYIHYPETAIKIINQQHDLQKDITLSMVTMGENVNDKKNNDNNGSNGNNNNNSNNSAPAQNQTQQNSQNNEHNNIESIGDNFPKEGDMNVDKVRNAHQIEQQSLGSNNSVQQTKPKNVEVMSMSPSVEPRLVDEKDNAEQPARAPLEQADQSASQAEASAVEPEAQVPLEEEMQNEFNGNGQPFKYPKSFAAKFISDPNDVKI